MKRLMERIALIHRGVKASIKGTWIVVYRVPELLEAVLAPDGIIQEYCLQIDRQDIMVCLRYAGS